ncbi:MAG: endopeptidase La [Candidatus Electryonea clarkiae]|nr:endopeptidase La [Candidatus Electryonea clarkiae]MDP8285835.1 endopeptidase La [Candidatus Electryonea clarkiae]
MANKETIEAVTHGKMKIPDRLPLITTGDLVVFPGIVVPLAVNDEPTIQMINEVMQNSGPRLLGTVLKRKDAGEIKSEDDLYSVGTAVIILRMLRMPDGSMRIIGQGLHRFKVKSLVQVEPYAIGEIEILRSRARKTVKLEALVRALREDFDHMAELSPQIPEEFKAAVHSIDHAGILADLIAANISVESPARQSVLEAIKIPERIILVRKLLARELEILKIGSEIQNETKGEIDKRQREYFLRHQLQTIKKELGEDEDGDSEISDWQKKIEEADLPEQVLEVAEKELKRLEKMNPASSEYSVITTYLDYLVTLPWETFTEDHLDLKKARKILDEDHFGLEDIKERILEVLAVRKLKPDAQGPIICLVGPPGVGKTSLGQSIARAMGRKFIRLALGGVRDEAEIRGHRRTYVGAMPGRILQRLRKVECRNPVFMLDEVDKLISDFRGDPSSALLEVLDPAQNFSFSDHYIDIEFDLSAIFFITTANYLEAIPPPLRDRMEVIQLPGYIASEKVQIAKEYLVPRQIEANGLKKSRIRFTDTALDDIVIYYTREAGVRNMERAIGKICRKVALKVAENGADGKVVVKRSNLAEFMGPRRITPSWKNRKSRVGVATGLAYTPVGGTTLQIETVLMPGKGNMRITGQLGDVMKESAQIATSWIRAHMQQLKIKKGVFTSQDLHLHIPEGATPKDGPSAGITMCTCLASRYSGRKVRSDVSMTGELTLEGTVLPIGGLREKVVAANRARIKHVIIPWDNQKDLEKVPEEVRSKIEFYPVKRMDEVLKIAMEDN